MPGHARFARSNEQGGIALLHCTHCGNNWPEVVPKAVPPKHCPRCGQPTVVRTVESGPGTGAQEGRTGECQGRGYQGPGPQGPGYGGGHGRLYS